MHEKSRELLNKAVADELAAVHQYMYFHFHCDDQGYDLLALLFKKTAIEEMLHIERLAERILFIGGDVELVAAHEVDKIHDVKAMLEKGKQMEESSVVMYNKFANECSANADSASKKLFEDLVLERNAITISMITKSSPWPNSATIIWPCSRSNGARTAPPANPRHRNRT